MVNTSNSKPFYSSIIPNDWEISNLLTLTEKIGSGITPSGGEKVYKQSGRPFIRSQNIGWGNLILDDVAFIDDTTHNNFKSTEIKEGDVFLNITGASIGRSAIADKTIIGGNVNQHVCIIRVKKDLLNPEFLNFYLLSSIGQNLVDSYQSGGNRQGLNFEQIKSFKIPLPQLTEQKAIANMLGKMNELINANDKLIIQKLLRKKWLMQNLLTGKIRLKGFETGKWKLINTGDTFEFVKSYSISRDGLSKSNNQRQIYCIHYGDIHAFYETNFLNFNTQKEIPQLIDCAQTIYEKDYLKEGDLIIADASEDYEGIGKLVEVKNIGKNIAVGGLHTIVLRANTEIIENIFRGYIFSSEPVKNSLRKLATGTSVYSVTKTVLSNLSLTIPESLQEQKAIAQILQSADKEIELLKTKTEKIKEQKKGMMQLLLTGKKRISLNN